MSYPYLFATVSLYPLENLKQGSKASKILHKVQGSFIYFCQLIKFEKKTLVKLTLVKLW